MEIECWYAETKWLSSKYPWLVLVVSNDIILLTYMKSSRYYLILITTTKVCFCFRESQLLPLYCTSVLVSTLGLLRDNALCHTSPDRVDYGESWLVKMLLNYS